jgi:hypothetical protein
MGGSKATASANTAHIFSSSPFTFPPSSFATDYSKAILEYWKSLYTAEILKWEELAQDIRSAYGQLAARFGNGLVFDGNDWEDQRYYHARNLFLKWTGYQTMQNVSVVNDTASMYVPTSLTQTVSGSL